MPTLSHVRFMLLIGVCSALPTLASAQSVQVRSTQLELGLAGALPLASSRYDHGVGLGGGLVARFALTRGRFVFDAGLEAGFLTVNETWYQGDATWIDDAFIVRLRAVLGVRYAFFSAERAQVYGRLGAGLEGRIGRYDELHDSAPDQPRQRDLSWAPVIEPSIGLRLGGAHRFALLQVAAPVAVHRQQPIRAHGDYGKSRAVDLTASLFVGWTL